MKNSLLLVKIGGSVITDKKTPYTSRLEIIQSIAKILKQVKIPMIIARGNGSFGHTSAKKYCRDFGYTTKLGIAKVAYDTMDLHTKVTEIFLEEGLPVISFRPIDQVITENGTVKESFFDPIRIALEQGLIPMVCGDIIWDTKKQSVVFSGEKILGLLCSYFQNKKYSILNIIELSNVNGVLNLKGEVIPSINSANWGAIKKHVRDDNSYDVTGGMRHKVEEALFAAELGIKTIIINGNSSRDIKKALKGKKVGTIIG